MTTKVVDDLFESLYSNFSAFTSYNNNLQFSSFFSITGSIPICGCAKTNLHMAVVENWPYLWPKTKPHLAVVKICLHLWLKMNLNLAIFFSQRRILIWLLDKIQGTIIILSIRKNSWNHFIVYSLMHRNEKRSWFHRIFQTIGTFL